MINFQYANEPIKNYDFTIKEKNFFNNNIKKILKYLDNSKKAFIFQNNNNDFPKNPMNKALFNLKNLIMETSTFGSNECDLQPQHYLYNNDGYTAFVFSKDKNILKMWACGAFDKKYHSHLPNGELYLSHLCGQGGASLIFDLLKEIIENGGKNNMVNLSDVKYLDLTAIPSFNTLNFYNKNNGLVPSNEIFNDTNNYGYNDYMNRLFKIILSLLYSPEYNELIQNLDKKQINNFWNNYIESHMRFIDYVFFYNTSKSKKAKQEFNEYFNKLDPIEDFKNTISTFDNETINKKLYNKLLKEFNNEKESFLNKIKNSNINKSKLKEIENILKNVDNDNIFELEDTINYINQNYL